MFSNAPPSCLNSVTDSVAFEVNSKSRINIENLSKADVPLFAGLCRAGFVHPVCGKRQPPEMIASDDLICFVRLSDSIH